MREVLVMTGEESKRLYVIQQVLERKIRQRQAAALLGRSVRQIRRLVRRIRREGPGGIGHRLRGRRSNRRHTDTLQQRVLALYQARYADFGPTLACEKLAERHRLVGGRAARRRGVGGGGGGGGARGRGITSGASARRALARWSRWTARTMTGWKVGGRSWC